MRVLDLFSGTGSATQAFRDRGHEVVSVELDPSFDATIHADILDLTPEDLQGPWDFIWASPPCTTFSVASIGAHWTGGHRAYEPKTEAAKKGMAIVAHTLGLIAQLREANPGLHYCVENPRGVLRKLPVMAGQPRRETVTYCAYGDDRMKPTDIWTSLNGEWTPRPMCKNGDPCHVRAPRGSRTGTQGRDNAKDRSRLPYDIGLELCLAVEGQLSK